MAKADGPVAPGGSDPPGGFIVVPPNGKRFEDPDVIRRLESFIRKRLAPYDIEVAWVVQPRIETFTVVARDGGHDRTMATRRAIRQELEGFDPDAPEVRHD